MKKKVLIAGISFLSLFVSTKGIAQVPTASFSTSQSTVCPGEVIVITDESTDSPTSWSYTLGSGSNTSTVQNPTISFATGGSYVISLEATNGNGTSAVYSETITVNPSPIITIAGSTSVCEGATASFTASGASSYVWNTGANTSTISLASITSSVVFTATGTSASGCIGTESVSVMVNALPVVNANATNTLICDGITVALAGTGADTYTWTGGVTDGVAFAPSVTNSYSVMGTNTLTGCTSTNVASITITVNPLPVISIGNFNICSGTTLTLNPTGASTYTFSNGSSLYTPTTNTTVSITGTSADGCVSSNTAVSSITVNTTPTVSVNSGSICEGAIFTMVASGADSYVFSNGSNTVNPSSTTSYSVTGTSLEGCVSSNTAVSTVVVNLNPVVSVNSGSICEGSVFTMVGSGAATYTFSNGSNTVNPSTTTSYSVTGTSAEGCLSSNTAVSHVTVNANPVVSVNSGTICSGTIFTITASGANTYNFSSGNATVNPSTTTSYSVTGTSLEGCVSSNTAVSTVSVNTTPTVSVNSGSICSGNSFTMIPAGASTYTFSNGSATVNPIATTSYSLTGTSIEGCISSNTAVSTVTVNATPTLAIAVSNTTICEGNSSTLTASGADTYTWNTTSNATSITVSPVSTTGYTVNGTSLAGCASASVAVASVSVNSQSSISASGSSVCPGNAATITPSGANTYTYVSGTTTLTGASATVSPVVTSVYSVSGTNANGCVSTGTNIASVTIVALTSPSLTVVANPTSVCSGVSSSLSVSGANSFTWTSPASNATQVVVNPATTTVYTVSGTGTNVCNGIGSVTLTVLTTPTVSVNSGTICSGYNFTMTGSGASTYTFSNASGTITNVVSPLTLTNYSVIGTSAQGCISNTLSPAISTVAVNASPVITAASGSVCSGLSYNIMPTGAVSYSINGVSSSTLGSVSPAGTTTYSITGSGSNNCVSPIAAIINVTVVSNPTVTVASTSSAICVGQATAIITASGANTYSWSTNASTNSVAVSPATTTVYTVTGTSSVGCTNTETVSVTVYTLPVVGITANNPFICVGQSTSLTANGAASYQWNIPSSNSVVVVNPVVTTNYTVTGTSSQGCTKTASISVLVNTVVLTVSQNTSLCSGTAYTLSAGGANTYTWNGNFLFQDYPLTPTSSAVYTVVATDANNCVLSKTVSINVFQLPTVNINISSTVICLGETATVSASGNATNYTWNNSSTGGTIVVTPTVDLVQTYVVTGTDNNNCSASATTTLAVGACNGIEKNNVSVNESSVYPNPNNGDFYINVTTTSNVLVINSLGQVVSSENMESGIHHLNYSNYNSGVYFIKITQGGSSKTIKVIKH